ncbi:MAG: hypothetical protein ABII80_01315 [bacterium]
MKINNWYGWIIEESLDSQEVFQEFETVKMKSEEADWNEHIVEIPEDKLNQVVTWLEKHLKPAWYGHLVGGDEIIVVYQRKSFKLKKGESFSEAAEYGRRLGIIEDQLPGNGLFELARNSGY